MSEDHNLVLCISRSILLNLYSTRTPPRILLKPPIEITAHSSLQILTPIQYTETFLGKKLTVETKHTTVIYLMEKVSEQKYRVMEATMTFMHIIEPNGKLNDIVDVPPSNLPKEIVEQLVAITMQETVPVLLTLFEKHMVPIALPININVEVKMTSVPGKEDK